MFIQILSIIDKILILILLYKLLISFFYIHFFNNFINKCSNKNNKINSQNVNPYESLQNSNNKQSVLIHPEHSMFMNKESNIHSSQEQQNIFIKHIPNIQFEFIGNLYNKEKNIMLKLYGRERIRYVWDYFIIYNNHSTQTKIDLSSHKNRLEHLDSLYIEIFQADFILYKNENKYKYYPYIISS